MEQSQKPSAEELLRKILELEEGHVHLKQEISKRRLSSDHHQMVSTHRHREGGGVYTLGPSSLWPVIRGSHEEVPEPFAMKLTETQYLNVMQSMGQAVVIFDLSCRVFFWNQAAERLYGFTADEAYGKTPTELLVEDPNDTVLSDYLLARTVNGESWSGEFPLRKKNGKVIMVIATNTPYRDANRRLIGGICITTAVHQHLPGRGLPDIASDRVNLDPQQPSHPSISSKLSNFASRVKLKIKKVDEYKDDEGGSDVTTSDHSEESSSLTPRGHIAPSPFAVFHSTGIEEEHLTIDSEIENKFGIRNILCSKREAWMGKRRIVWPWQQSEDQSLNAILIHQLGWKRLDLNQEQMTYVASPKLDLQLLENNNLASHKNEASGLWLSSQHVSSTSSNSSSSSCNITSDTIIKVEREADYEILWEDLITKGQIGQGSCGTVYHGLWHGSDVAIKLFVHQEYSDDVILSFRKEVALMKRLRHPNILLFMGAVTTPPHLSIVTEFLPRGSLFRVLQRNSTRLDWRRRLHMAVDIARGMNYLHQCNPPIIHRDLKSSNLLVDKNWTVKVGDFGLSRVRHETYLKTKTGKGTPQWMAPEILRNEQANEKSDVYSYGVVLWEITTEKIPWDDLNPMQVIGAVGYMNRQLEIPKDLDPVWASLIENCWCSEPESRPTFQEILYKLRDLQKKVAAERGK